MTPKDISALIRKRRSIFPKTYIDKPIPKEIIEQVLENANWAPTHKFTEPWRFKVFTGASLESLGSTLADIYKAHTPEEKFKERKFEKIPTKTNKSGCVIAICMQRDAEERIPEWEEIASVAMAVQNFWLACSANGIGCYWSSPKSIVDDKDFLKLEKDQRCLGLLYIGVPKEAMRLVGERKEIAEKVEWRDGSNKEE